MGDAPSDGRRVVVRNRRARHEFEIIETWEAGMVLVGTEVKALRDARGNMQDAFARLDRGEIWLHSMHISPYEPGNRYNHDPLRPRKLLLSRNEIRKMVGQVEQKGLTLVPLELYFRRGKAKVTIALVRGKKLHDKREDLKKRAAERDMEREYKTR
jgi:SsrA-binding protein